MYARLHDLTAKPRLFFDLMPPARVSRRRDRIRAWCGPATWRVLEDNHARGHVPAAGGTMLGRSLKPKERIAVAVKSVGRLCLADRVTGTRTGTIDVSNDGEGNVRFRVNRRGEEIEMRFSPDIARQAATLLNKAADGWR